MQKPMWRSYSLTLQRIIFINVCVTRPYRCYNVFVFLFCFSHVVTKVCYVKDDKKFIIIAFTHVDQNARHYSLSLYNQTVQLTQYFTIQVNFKFVIIFSLSIFEKTCTTNLTNRMQNTELLKFVHAVRRKFLNKTQDGTQLFHANSCICHLEFRK